MTPLISLMLLAVVWPISLLCFDVLSDRFSAVNVLGKISTNILATAALLAIALTSLL